MAVAEQVVEDQDTLNETADLSAAEGASALRPLPGHIATLQLAYWEATAEWTLVSARLKRNMKRANDLGRGSGARPFRTANRHAALQDLQGMHKGGLQESRG